MVLVVGVATRGVNEAFVFTASGGGVLGRWWCTSARSVAGRCSPAEGNTSMRRDTSRSSRVSSGRSVIRPEHIKAVSKYWWTHQAEGKLKPQFILTQADYERFKSSVTKALDNYEETENVLIKQIASQIRETEESRMEMLKAVLEPETPITGEDEEVWSNGELIPDSVTSLADSEKPGPSHWPSLPNEVSVLSEASPLTFIGQQVSDQGNVHTGALPPWMLPDDDDEAGSSQDIGPSMEDFLKHKEKMALKKLPPNRVGANFDHNAQTDEGWLPSFGRVWNSGRRWESRHQYRKEAGGKGGKRKRTEDT
ncbi:hypothetical protein GDO81_014426 [Engystomops pustulosus]|uniref:Coiled-coil domain-containing protein 84 n=1 Tax=Engystomops pustulosus TaxID=76066 RepID=A0AAV7BAJ7_ENGPU|nr:hypothetical protein GDO81_014426 [Engystomops pustulosus]